MQDAIFNLIEAVDKVDRSISQIKGMTILFNDVIDCFPVPSDAAELDHVNSLQISAMALFESVVSLLRIASDDIMNDVRMMGRCKQ